MTLVALLTLSAAVLLALYAYVGYPALLRLLSALRRPRGRPSFPSQWPMVTITIPAYNEAAQIRGLIESLLALDYPADRRQVLIVSDASDDGTDEIVQEYAGRGIELLRTAQRGGKTAAENIARPHVKGEIVINTDASIRIHPGALKPMIACFSDPSIGVASGRDVSVANTGDQANAGESGYVGYEMQIRSLETRIDGIIGSSGCFYAIRSHLHNTHLPGTLSRDFASALIAKEHGYRAVSVDEAVCFVPRTASLHREYNRKVRTFARGMQTLMYKRHLLNPFKFGLFAWMLFSHKVCRWLVPWAAVMAVPALAVLAPTYWWAATLLVAAGVCSALAWAGWLRARAGSTPRVLSLLAFIAAGNVSVLRATIKAVRGDNNSVWEPTRREVSPAAEFAGGQTS
jgi:cellulose synthase/poly-beta-1,6-N-acetylglucosamine synthase-like glycosyltransferase